MERQLQQWQREQQRQDEQQLRPRGAGWLLPAALNDPYAFAALWRQYRACRRNKRRTHNALAFEIDAEANLLELQRELREHTYRPGRSICFVTSGPKPREVFAAEFRDRVVHHLLVSRQEPLYERQFIHDSYACRRGKGTLAASDRLMAFLRQATANGRWAAWSLHLDVASFFSSIDKAVLAELLAARFRHPEVRWPTETVLFHDPTGNFHYQTKGRPVPPPWSPNYPVPPEKSLFGARGRRGLPIGNLTSQFWGNVYLNEVDQFVKRRLKVRHYLRYVDDLVLLDGERARLEDAREAIGEFLHERLRLRLRAGRAESMPAAEGVEFVGWKTWWDHRLPRRRTVGNLTTALAAFERAVIRPGPFPASRSLLLAGDRRRAEIERVRATLASYAGHLRHGRAWRGFERTWARHAWAGVLWRRHGWRWQPRWDARRERHARSVGVQYRALTARLGGAALAFWPAGRFVEFYGPQRLVAERALGLRRARLARAGYALAAGFPASRWGKFAQRALAAGCPVVVIARRRGNALPARIVMPLPARDTAPASGSTVDRLAWYT